MATKFCFNVLHSYNFKNISSNGEKLYIFRTLSNNGDNNKLDEPSLFLSKHWSTSQSIQPGHHHHQQQVPPVFRNNNNVEPLKILTSELAENISSNGSVRINSSNGGGRHHDSGYISPNLPSTSGSGKAFFDGNNPNQHQAAIEQPHRVDPVLLQQVLQQQQHPKHQHMINHRPITGKFV